MLFSLVLGRRTEAGVTVLEVATEDTDCDDAESEGEGVSRVMAGTCAFSFPLGRGDRGVAVCVEVLDSEETERDGEGDTERDDDADSGSIVGEATGDGARCEAMTSLCSFATDRSRC